MKLCCAFLSRTSGTLRTFEELRVVLISCKEFFDRICCWTSSFRAVIAAFDTAGVVHIALLASAEDSKSTKPNKRHGRYVLRSSIKGTCVINHQQCLSLFWLQWHFCCKVRSISFESQRHLSLSLYVAFHHLLWLLSVRFEIYILSNNFIVELDYCLGLSFLF